MAALSPGDNTEFETVVSICLQKVKKHVNDSINTKS